MKKRGLSSRIMSVLLSLMMLLSLLPTAVLADESATKTYTKVTSADELVSGEYVMVANNGYAPGVLDGTWVTAVAVTAANDQVIDPTGGVWTLTVDKNGTILSDANGKAIAPKATVKDEAGNVVETAGYKLTYANNIKTGKATVTATGTGVYEGTVSTTFAIKDNTVANTNSMNASARTSVSSGKVSVTWGKVATATGYEVYVAQCSKGFSKKPTKTVSAKTQSLSFSKIAGKAISAKSIYKFKVKAYRMNGKTKIYLGTSLTCHAAGSRAIFTNVKAMTVAKKSVSVSKGKTVKMPKIYTVKANVNKKLLPTDHAPLLRYWSTNTKIATVTSKGTIKGVGKGTCYVRAMAQNGKTVTVKITVK